MSAAWKRLDGPKRLAGIDLARGLAVIGMLAAHLIDIDDGSLADPSTWADVVNGRSSILFATLAGVSIALVTGGPRPFTGGARSMARRRLAVRAALIWLLGVGLLACGVPVFVILPAYAVLFLLALPLLGLRARTLAVLAVILGLVTPWVQAILDAWPGWDAEDADFFAALIGWHYPFPTWITFLVAGLAIGRTDLRALGTQLRVLAVGAGAAIVGYALDAVGGASERAEAGSYAGAVWTARAHSSGFLEVVGSGGFALAVVAACLLACRTWLRWPALPLRAVGAMALTAYAGQIVVWAIAAGAMLGDSGDLAGFRALEPFWPFAAGVLVFCTAWSLLVGRGPVEWVVDRVASGVTGTPPAGRDGARMPRLG